MAKLRFSEAEIADILQQCKSGIPNKEVCEKYGFSPSTLRRWQELHAEEIRSQLKKMESTAARVYLCCFIIAAIVGSVFSKAAGLVVAVPFILYCLYYIWRFRQVSARHIDRGLTSVARYGMGAKNAFYQFCWLLMIFVVFFMGYLIVHL